MIFSRELKFNFGKTIAWIIVLSILTGLFLSLFPLMQDVNMKGLFDSFVASLSEKLSKVLGFDERVDYTNIGQYLAFVYQYVAVLTCIFAMQLGASSLSKEQGLGSIEYIYSNPISRSEIVTAKLMANILNFIIFLAIILAINFGLTAIIPKFIPMDKISFTNLEVLTYLGKIFLSLLGSGLVFMSIGFFFSAMTKSTNFSEATSLLFVILAVILVMIGKVYGGMFFEVIRNFPFEVFKPIKFLLNSFSIFGIIVNLAAFVIFTLLTYLIYGAKEFDY